MSVKSPKQKLQEILTDYIESKDDFYDGLEKFVENVNRIIHKRYGGSSRELLLQTDLIQHVQEISRAVF